MVALTKYILTKGGRAEDAQIVAGGEQRGQAEHLES